MTVRVSHQGARLVSVKLGDHEFIAFPTDPPLFAESAIVAPVVNRTPGGAYRFDGESRQLDVNEPDRHNALHGWADRETFLCTRHTPEQARFTARLRSAPGWPHQGQVVVDVHAGNGGLVMVITVQNTGSARGPFMVAAHPYFCLATPSVESWLLRAPAECVVLTDERLNLRTVCRFDEAGEAAPFDFRPSAEHPNGRPVGATRLDTCLTGFTRDRDGVAWISIQDPTTRLAVGMARPLRCAMVVTPDFMAGDPATARWARGALAIEPQSHLVNGLVLDDYFVLEPGEAQSVAWAIVPQVLAPAAHFGDLDGDPTIRDVARRVAAAAARRQPTIDTQPKLG